MNDLIISKGTIIFDPVNRTKKHFKQSSWKKSAIIMVNDDSYLYYQWFIEKRFPFIQGVKGDTNWLNPPLRGTHVTIINDKISDNDSWNLLKKKYNGQEVHFFFNWEGLRNNGEHWYFKVECPVGQSIRDEGHLGKPYFDFHMTIGLVPEESKIKREHNNHVRNILIKTP